MIVIPFLHGDELKYLQDSIGVIEIMILFKSYVSLKILFYD